MDAECLHCADTGNAIAFDDDALMSLSPVVYAICHCPAGDRLAAAEEARRAAASIEAANKRAAR